ncbi:MAG TPA: hypothetical protein VK773_05710 [Acidimicrobiales bacterium]|nr:hypothetical protein [Acidimicrobiales bacterium]
MPGPSRTGPGALAHWWARLRGVADDPPDDELEEGMPTAQDDTERVPPASLDDVLRDAAQQRDPRGVEAGDRGGPAKD